MYNGHTVILGWTDKTIFVLGELLAMQGRAAARQSRSWWASSSSEQVIVVLGENDRYRMKREINLVYPKATRPRGVRVICREGLTTEIDDLMRVSIASARTVIVLAASRRPRGLLRVRGFTSFL